MNYLKYCLWIILAFSLTACGNSDVSTQSADGNNAPTLNSISDISVTSGGTVSFSPSANDADGDRLSFSYSGWMTSSNYVTVASDVGLHTVTVTVSDGTLTASQDVYVAVSDSSAPNILYTDIVSGPNSGGESNNGAYLSLFGLNFGGSSSLGSTTKVYINDVEVADYKFMGLAESQFLGSSKAIQRISVQIGAIGNPTAGVELPIKLVVDTLESNIDKTFIVQPGDFLFVDPVSGNDDTAVKNNITKPWQHVQLSTATSSGAAGEMDAGDTMVLRGGDWEAEGYDGHLLKMSRWATGSSPNGITDNGYMTFIAYPGEDVNISPMSGGKGGISGTSDAFSSYGKYVQIANLHISGGDETVIDGPINLQYGSDNWRVVNNELHSWDAESIDDYPRTRQARAGGLAGEGSDVFILGNHIHDIGGGTLNHGIYYGSGDRVEMAYNHIHHTLGGNIIQTYDSVGTYGLDEINIHHNLMHDGIRHGMNIGGGSNRLKFWNNIVYNTDHAGIRFDVTSNETLIEAYGNTLYNIVRNAPAHFYGAIYNTSNTTGLDVQVRNNIVYAAPIAQNYFSAYGNAAGITFSNNLYYGISASPPAAETTAFTTDPLFVNVSSHDFHLQAGSDAIDNGTTVSSVLNDYDFNSRPQGSGYDIGAYEKVSP